jgi:ATP-dependent protease ClpP protease subunit
MLIFLIFLLFNWVNCNNVSTSISPRKVIKLTEDNCVSLKGQVNDITASNFVSDISKIKGNDVYVYLLTPGGSIVSGNHIIQQINAVTSMGKNVMCIADNAYSMGFAIFQACPTRYVMDHSLIMQHQASLTVGGPIKQAANRFRLVNELEKQGNNMQSKRLGMSEKEFHDFYVHDGWLYGSQITDMKAADEIVHVVCDMNTEKTKTYTIDTWFGKVELEEYVCPMMHALKSIKLAKNESLILERVNTEFSEFANNYDANKFVLNAISS